MPDAADFPTKDAHPEVGIDVTVDLNGVSPQAAWETEPAIDPAAAAAAQSLLAPLAAKQEEFAYLPLTEKARLLAAVVARAGEWGAAEAWGRAATAIRRIDPDSGEGASKTATQMLLLAAVVCRLCGRLRRTLLELEAGATPSATKVDVAKEFGFDVSELKGAEVVPYDVGTNPFTKVRTILLHEDGPEGRTHGAAHRRMLANRAKPPAEREPLGAVCVVLGAGNQSFLAVCDLLHHLFVRGSVALLKVHPLQVPIKDRLDHLLEPLIRPGYVVTVEADLPLTQALVHSPLVARVHLTGGAQTHDALVWGTAAPQQRKAANRPVLKAEMMSELGAVTPFIVVPSDGEAAEWTPAAIQVAARAAATNVAENVSCNCLAAKVLVLPADARYRDLADAVVQVVTAELFATGLEPAWYPGTPDRYARWLQAVENNGPAVLRKTVGPTDVRKDVGSLPGSDTVLPFAIAELGDVDSVMDKTLFTVEPFAPVLTVVRLPGPTAAAYVAAAFAFATRRLWGNLAATVFAPPSAHGVVLPRLLRGDLLYGTVCLNCPTHYGYQEAGYWGGPRGANTLQDVQSGVGEVTNTLMFDRPRNAICWVPFGQFQEPQVPPLVVARVLSRVLALGWGALLPQWARGWWR